MPQLRPYQQQAVDALRHEYRSGARSVLFVLPTGGGNGLKSCLPPVAGTMPAQCKIEGCCKPVDFHGMCGMHAQRMRRYGDPEYITPEQQRRANNRAAQLARFDSVKSTTYRKRNGRHEHRVVAEEMLGRPLEAGEIVHHIDGNKHNNDPSNLQVMTQSDHLREHFMPQAEPIAWNGKSMFPRQWAEEFGMTYSTFYQRYAKGWSMERIANTPVRKWTRRND
jgi:hypothetical protein